MDAGSFEFSLNNPRKIWNLLLFKKLKVFFQREEIKMTLIEIQNKISKYNRVKSEGYNEWIIDVRTFKDCLGSIEEHLSKEELRRSNSIRVKKNRDLFCLRKGITRIILSSFFSMVPCDLEYDYSISGKPFVSSTGCRNYSFNISHSKEYLFLGIAKDREIGVDIERISPAFNYSIVAKSIFSEKEETVFNSYDELSQLKAFYKMWVQKEAISKALGLGISIGFNKFSVNTDPNIDDEKYSKYFKELKCSAKVRVRFEKDYFLAEALVAN